MAHTTRFSLCGEFESFLAVFLHRLDSLSTPTQAKTGLEWATRLKAAIALHFAYYNFCGVHSSLRVTPAMEAGLSDHVWTIAELLAME